MRFKPSGTCICRLAILSTVVASASGQTVTTNGAATPANHLPMFTGDAIIGDSGITTTGGNLGIGTNPGYPLDVVGDLNFTGAVRYYGTPLLVSGGSSTGVGLNALPNPANGSYNVAIGGNTLTSNISGSSNTAIGFNALYFNTEGSYNMALGSYSLISNTTGNANVGVGSSSLNLNTTGNNNSAVGGGALHDNTVGNENSGFGSGALGSSTGNDNSGFGINALESLVTGSTNIALGSNSLTGLVSGTDNVAVGDGAGDDVATPHDGGSTWNTEGTQNTYLGASTVGLATNDNNETVLGAGAVGSGSNSVTLGNAQVASTILRGNITITPTASGASISFPDGTTQRTAWTGVLTGTVTGGGDYAESVDVTGNRSDYGPGDLIVIDSASRGRFKQSTGPYSKLVAGIYSTKPGVRGRRQTTPVESMVGEIPMAMVGIVPTKVSTENGPIKAGDLLVTSSKPGTAMKGSDPARMLGAIVGKALSDFDSGQGIIEVLVTLQ